MLALQTFPPKTKALSEFVGRSTGFRAQGLARIEIANILPFPL